MILVVAATERELAGAAGAATLVCGIGPVEAAAATAGALAEMRPDVLLHVGIAGARGIPVPQLVIGSEAVYEDAPADGVVPERVRPDPRLVDAAQRALPEARVMPIGTSARVGGTKSCEVEAMEGFAVLRAARLAGVPAVEVRAVSNEIDERDRTRWRFDDALAALAAALPRLLSELDG
ncbi:MAG: phosphorylase family protein [Gaiellaceae bacterium]